MTERRFFVVERFNGTEHYALEYGDHSDRYSKEKKAGIIYRCEIEDTALTLDQCRDAYRQGWRAKPKSAAKIEAPKTYNSVRRKMNR